jgi:hypothetical protein
MKRLKCNKTLKSIYTSNTFLLSISSNDLLFNFNILLVFETLFEGLLYFSDSTVLHFYFGVIPFSHMTQFTGTHLTENYKI